MIDIKKAKERFDKYASNYDFKDNKISLKYYHSLRVMNISEKIAISLNLNEEDILLAKLIGLLHDIGRFDQETDFHSFDDIKTIDHGYKGCFTLFNNKLVREFINDDMYDNIIEKAIFSHNKISIPKEYNEREQIFAKIIRDADKLDIFYIISDNNDYPKENVGDDDYSKKNIDALIRGELVDERYIHTSLDHMLLVLGLVYDLNYEYSFNILKEKKYIDMILERIKTNDNNRINMFNEIKRKLNNYINRNAGDNNVR